MDTSGNQSNTNNTNLEKNENSNLGKLKKNGEPRKQLTDEQKARRAEVLAKGRAIAHERRRELEATKKQNVPQIKPVPEPVPEPEPEKDSDDDIEYVSKKKSKKKKAPKKKIIIMDESESSSSEEEVIIKKKKKKKPTPPPRAPTPPPVVVQQPKPSIPQPSEAELERLRRDKIKKYQDKQKKDRMMANIFG